jgi:4-carboxymuconolactone decarboxylase
VSASTPRAARIEPLAKDRWGDDEKGAVAAGFGARAVEELLSDAPDTHPLPNVVSTLVRHPKMAGAFLRYNNVLLFKPTIEARHRELMILRVAWRTRAPYEWIQHVRIARSVGISDAEIEAVGERVGAGPWSSLEADLLAATDQLLDHYCIDDDTWARLADHLDERQLMEVTFVVGTYTLLAMAFNSFGLELDADLRDVDAPSLP